MQHIIAKYGGFIVALLVSLAVILAALLVYVWWVALAVPPISQPGDFLKIGNPR